MSTTDEVPAGGIDFARSHAILLGVSQYADPELRNLPAAEHSLQKMAQTLTGPNCGWPPERVHTFVNLRSRDEVWRSVLHLIDEARHTLLFYYVGHGQLIEGNSDLGMALADTAFDARYRRTGSLLWSDLRAELDSLNRTRRTDILMLDCCYSGLATGRGLGPADASQRIGRAVDTEGMFTMTASRFNELALHTEGEHPVTYFAEYFSDIIRNGIADQPQWLTPLTVFDELRGRFAELHDEDIPQPPRPTQASVGNAHRLLFARNSSPRATSLPTYAPPYEPALHPSRSGDPDRPVGVPTRRRALLALGGVCAAAATAGAVTWLPSHFGAHTDTPHQGGPSGSSPGPHTQAAASTGTKPASTPTPARITRAVPVLTPLTGHTDAVKCVAFSTTDPHLMASASADTTIRLWDVADPAHVRLLGKPLTGHADAVGCVTFRPRGTVLAGCNRVIRLWDTAHPDRPQPLGAPLDGHADDVNSVAFSADGNLLASTGVDRTVVLWDTTDPTDVQRWGQPLYGHTDNVMTAVFSPRGHLLASGGFDTHVLLWDVSNPSLPLPLGAPLTGHTSAVLTLAFSPDGLTLASAGLDGTILLWNVNDPEHARRVGPTVTGHTNAVNALSINRRSIMASAGSDTTILLHDLSDPAHPRAIGHPLTGFRPANPVLSAAFSPGGQLLAAGSTDDTVRLWQLR